MILIGYLIKEIGRILLKKGYKSHSDLLRGLRLYKATPPHLKKPLFQCIAEVDKLFRYWHAFPDTYFRFGMFLKGYTDFDKMKSFVPQYAYYHFSKTVQPKYNLLINDKIIFHDLMTHYGLPVPTRFFTFRSGEFRNGSELMTDNEVDKIVNNINDDRIFVKKFTGGAASGVSIFTKTCKGRYVDCDGEEVNAKMIRNKYANQDVFFEKQLIQEPILSQFNPDTVNTIRVLTYKDKVISAAVRFGGKGSFVDNTAKGGVAVSLDIHTGILGNYGAREYDLTHYYEHPDSHIQFANTVVTQWPEVKRLVEKTLKYLPYYNSVGFDVATTNDGPVIIEINTGAGVYLSQMGKEFGIADSFNK